MIETEIVDGLIAEDTAEDRRLIAVFEEMTASFDDDAVDDAPAEFDDSAVAEEDEFEWAEMV